MASCTGCWGQRRAALAGAARRACGTTPHYSVLARIVKKILACTHELCDSAGMAKALTITEFARLGGKARAKKLGKKRLQESARRAAQARWAKEKAEK
jgi:hypothetical protein